MSTESRTDAETDLQAICDAIAQRKPIDPAVAARVEERGRRATDEIYARHGVLDVAVDLVREVRDE